MADQNITLDDNLVANLSGILNSAGIPNFLWSNYLLTIYGVSTFVDGVTFVVPDGSTKTASSLLMSANSCLIPCPKHSTDCHFSNGLQRPPPPSTCT